MWRKSKAHKTNRVAFFESIHRYRTLLAFRFASIIMADPAPDHPVFPVVDVAGLDNLPTTTDPRVRAQLEREIGLAKSSMNRNINAARQDMEKLYMLNHAIGKDVANPDEQTMASLPQLALVNHGIRNGQQHPQSYFTNQRTVTAADFDRSLGIPTLDLPSLTEAVNAMEEHIDDLAAQARRGRIDDAARMLDEAIYSDGDSVSVGLEDLEDYDSEDEELYRRASRILGHGIKRRRISMQDSLTVMFNRNG